MTARLPIPGNSVASLVADDGGSIGLNVTRYQPALIVFNFGHSWCK